MSGITQIAEGAVLPIYLQIEDGNALQFPQAEVRDDANNLLQTIDLAHQSSGLYYASPMAYVMPVELSVCVTYIVYSDAGHTTESTDYLRDCDIFRTVDPDDYKAGVSPTVGEIRTEMEVLGGSLDNLHKLQGLDLANPMTVTPASRVVGTIDQTISGDGTTTTTVTRTA